MDSIFQPWLTFSLGKQIDIDHAFGDQCVDVVLAWAEQLYPGVPWTVSIGYGNAKDLFAAANPAYFDKILYTVGFVPQEGDVFVKDGTPANPEGHTGAVINANANTMHVIQQDGYNPAGVAYEGDIALQNNHIIGFLRPKIGEPVGTFNYNAIPSDADLKAFFNGRLGRDPDAAEYANQQPWGFWYDATSQELFVRSSAQNVTIHELQQEVANPSGYTLLSTPVYTKNPALQTLKLGKLPARPDAVKFSLTQYFDAKKATAMPAAFGHEALEKNWQMLGNDQYGDCVWAGAAHETMLWNLEAGKTVGINTSNVLSDYAKVTGFNPNDPNTDQGTDMQAAASYRLKTGVVDMTNQRHKIGAYLAIALKNEALLKQSIFYFSGVGIGIQFPSSAMDQFNAGKPWSVVAGAKIEGGHYVPAVGYDAYYVYVITWGKVQKMSWSFFKKYADEAIVYLSPEMLKNGKSLEGFDLNQLQADLKAL